MTRNNGEVKLDGLRINGFRSFIETEWITFDRVNVFIGPNNSGKSSVLKAIYLIQGGNLGADVRGGFGEARIDLSLVGVDDVRPWENLGHIGSGQLEVNLQPTGQATLRFNGYNQALQPLPMREPDHFVVPYFSRRKTAIYQREVNEDAVLSISPDFGQLTAKLSRLGNPSYPFHRRYAETCEAILGFVVTSIPAANGQIPGIYLPDGGSIPLDQMGEGVPNIVGLLADLAQSRGKLFLIEEPENDLHPEALKALLNLILESSSENQIVVSTHSNIVARYLGAATDSKLYYVSSEPGTLPPVARIEEVESNPSARLKVLRDLGYSFSDFDLWDGWLILEEPSAERIIRDYLIPWFAPKLSRIRTLSADGNSQVAPTFQDFYRLVRFTHLEEAYRDAAWVLIDGDDPGRQIVSELRRRFPDWTESHFDTFSAANFEAYYPADFSGDVSAALGLKGKEKRQAKRQLLERVRAWLDEDEARGREALAASAAPVIERLRQIEKEILS